MKVLTIQDILTSSSCLENAAFKGKIVSKEEAISHLQSISEINSNLQVSDPLDRSLAERVKKSTLEFLQKCLINVKYFDYSFYFIDSSGAIACRPLQLYSVDLRQPVILFNCNLVECIPCNNSSPMHLLEINEFAHSNQFNQVINSFDLQLDFRTQSLLENRLVDVKYENLKSSKLSLSAMITAKSSISFNSKGTKFFVETHSFILDDYLVKKPFKIWIIFNQPPEYNAFLKEIYGILQIGQVYNWYMLKAAKIQVSNPNSNTLFQETRVLSFIPKKSSFIEYSGYFDHKLSSTEIQDVTDSFEEQNSEFVVNLLPLTITEIIDKDLCIFKLDNRYILYTHLQSLYHIVASLRVGTVISLFNVHLIKLAKNSQICISLCDYSTIFIEEFSPISRYYAIDPVLKKSVISKFKQYNFYDCYALELISKTPNLELTEQDCINLLCMIGYTPFQFVSKSFNHWECTLAQKRYPIPEFQSFWTVFNRLLPKTHLKRKDLFETVLDVNQVLTVNEVMIGFACFNNDGILTIQDNDKEFPLHIRNRNSSPIPCLKDPCIAIIRNTKLVAECFLCDDYSTWITRNYFSVDLHDIKFMPKSYSVTLNSGYLFLLTHSSTPRINLSTNQVSATLEGIAMNCQVNQNKIEFLGTPKILQCILTNDAVSQCSTFSVRDYFLIRSTESNIVQITSLEQMQAVEICDCLITENSLVPKIYLSNNDTFKEMIDSLDSLADSLFDHLNPLAVSSLVESDHIKYGVNGYSKNLISIRAIVSKKHFKELDPLYSEGVSAEAYQNIDLNQFGYGKSGKVLIVTVQCTETQREIDIYMDLRFDMYPQGLVVGALADFKKLSVKRSKKSPFIICFFNSDSSFECIKLDYNAVKTNPPVGIPLVYALLNSFAITRDFYFNVQVQFIKSVTVWLHCADCEKAISLCSCLDTIESTHEIRAKAQLMVADATFEALIDLRETRDVFKLLLIDYDTLDRMEEYLSSFYSLTFERSQWETYLPDDSSDTLSNFKARCSSKKILKRIRINLKNVFHQHSESAITSLDLSLERIKTTQFKSLNNGLISTWSNSLLVLECNNLQDINCTSIVNDILNKL